MAHWTDSFEKLLRDAKIGPVEKPVLQVKLELNYVRDLTNAGVYHEGYALTLMLGHQIECINGVVIARITPNDEIEFVAVPKDSWILKKIADMKLRDLPTWSMVFDQIKTWRAPVAV